MPHHSPLALCARVAHDDAMSDSQASPPDTVEKPGIFPNTRVTWLQQVRSDDHAESDRALTLICEAYWKPVYATIRHKWREMSHHDAMDAAQGFWEWLLEQQVLRTREPHQKFRTFLMNCFDNFQRNQWRAQQAVKRGGGNRFVSRDSEEWTEHYESQLGTAGAPDDDLDRMWNHAAVEAAFREVEADWAGSKRGAVFEALKTHFKQGAERGGYGEIARTLGMTEENVRWYASQMRKDLRAARNQWEAGET